MKTQNNLTYKQAVLYGVITELILVSLQFVYLKNYTSHNPEADFAFTADYMMSRGFYVFQIIGFFVYSVVVFVLINKMKVKTFYKVLALIGAGVVVELVFYAIVPADYQLVYFYSVLDKFIAGIFGAVVYFYTSDND